LPPELLRREGISPTAKFLYLVAQAPRPGSLAELGRIAGVERRQTARLCGQLARTGWMKLVRSGRETVPVPVCPVAVEERQAERLLKLVAMSRHKGECLMKCWLDLLVASDNFVDNARPGFLGNPLSGESLEFDRYYLDGVAFEFNGPQHYGPTASFPDEQAFREARARDLLKKGLGCEKGIELVEITADDLSLDGMTARLPALLPRSIVDRDGPYAKALERLCQEYRAKATVTPWDRSTPDAKAGGGSRSVHPVNQSNHPDQPHMVFRARHPDGEPSPHGGTRPNRSPGPDRGPGSDQGSGPSRRLGSYRGAGPNGTGPDRGRGSNQTPATCMTCMGEG